VKKMVERTEARGFEELNGEVISVELIPNDKADWDNAQQILIGIDPIGIELKGKTGKWWVYISLPRTATETSVPQGSAVDRYLQEVEGIVPQVKKTKTVLGAFELLKGKRFTFKPKKLGRAFEGREARDYWCPVSLFTG